MSDDRHSKADPVELIIDPDQKARREAENGVRQFNAALEIIKSHILEPDKSFRLTQALILRLHEKALAGIHPLAGTYRNTPVFIGKSKHLPPPHLEVPDCVAEMCSYVNTNWDERNAIQLSAYVLWRMNWIHPFADGNGRTARVVSYVVLSIKLNSVLPGTPTIPDQIAADKQPYYAELENADASWKHERLALSGMEAMLERMLAQQLLRATEEAGN
ncbi:Fic family protein [Methylocella tundrae]|uniref:Filamentation induced by cAMP protein Fic n=1 Tax=Methylocella tundrae TaxID=227605 RepID=A0A4U8Z0P5_METTU|nr:Fic family protein [Methylocella tundrae]WPP06039.1 Fic family protein [Methylocella tundrae]VFU08625.1 Filamentation induced by cAMP protein Fic [Methylocella tundrae]